MRRPAPGQVIYQAGLLATPGTLLYMAPFARKPWMLPDETRIGLTRDMSLEAIRRVLAARLIISQKLHRHTRKIGLTYR